MDLRRALNYKDAVSKHQVSGAYLHFKDLMQSKCPEKDWPSVAKDLDNAFFQRFMDADLLAALQGSVPPGDVTAIAAFRTGVAEVQSAWFSWERFCLAGLTLRASRRWSWRRWSSRRTS